ncbi:hypothetical protein J6590_070890 [Homalodisca vitripennis]|nr:hypothetical protein J6590_070890 [Homalodisca vitripennis]
MLSYNTQVAPVVDCRKTSEKCCGYQETFSTGEKCRHTTPRWRQLLIVGKPLKSVVDTKKLSQLEKNAVIQHPGKRGLDVRIVSSNVCN